VKRVLFLIKGLGAGGAERLLVSAAPYLGGRGIDYEAAYLLPWKDALAGDLAGTGVPVTCLEATDGARWLGRLRRLVREHGIGLVHAHSPSVAAAARLALPRGWGTRFVYTEHNVWSRYHPLTRWANMLTYPRNDHVFAVSDRVRRSIRYPPPLARLPMPTVETLHHGLDLAAVARWGAADGVREELGIPPEAPVVGTVANLKPHKGHRVLLRAAALVRREVPDARFVLVGTGPLEAELRRQAVTLGLDGAVVFAGMRLDAPRVADAFDVFVLPSFQEGLSIALVEAMALGKAIVVTPVGGQLEVVEPGVHAVVVPPGDPGSLACAVVELLRDPDRRSSLGRAARERAVRFDIRRTVARLEAVYEELLA
jgi:glycosyltransferase involved in cell wall biosynthesis